MNHRWALILCALACNREHKYIGRAITKDEKKSKDNPAREKLIIFRRRSLF